MHASSCAPSIIQPMQSAQHVVHQGPAIHHVVDLQRGSQPKHVDFCFRATGPFLTDGACTLVVFRYRYDRRVKDTTFSTRT